MRREGQRLLDERAIAGEVVSGPTRGRRAEKAPRRTVTVNLAESPLGWLFAHGHLSERQFAAGERLRADWERGNLDPRVTMAWDAAPVARGRGGGSGLDLTIAQLDARRRFQSAVGAAGTGLADILWRVVCAGEGMRDAERALGWPARAGKLVLLFALDRVADHYRLP
ncbi:MAG: DUF6456 domain-containing protein [Sphingomicrobium sp.]